jgi:hypothetical protein
VYKDLHNCTHVFLRQDATRRALVSPYSGPYQALSMKEKMLQLLVSGKSDTASADRVKPAYILNDTDCGYTTLNPSASPTPATEIPATPPPPPTTPGLSHTLQHLSNHLRGGGGVMWEPPTKQFYSNCQFSGDQPSNQSERSTAAPIPLDRARLTGSV